MLGLLLAEELDLLGQLVVVVSGHRWLVNYLSLRRDIPDAHAAANERAPHYRKNDELSRRASSRLHEVLQEHELRDENGRKSTA